MKIVREGFWVIVPSSMLSIVLTWLTLQLWYLLIFIFTLVMMFFFRDPARNPPNLSNVVLAPADGRVNAIHQDENGLAIFVELSVVNCHLQRAPMSGTVRRIVKTSGRHRRIHLFIPKLGFARKKMRCATENAQNVIEIELENSKRMWLTQIVGAFARRLKSYVKVGQKLQAGEKVGLIYFGSLVKLELEGQFNLKIRKGVKVKAGETIIAIQKD
ncbi:MAG: phosphatidylserine decarboxylase [Candidatus Helarchaeota archaeon]